MTIADAPVLRAEALNCALQDRVVSIAQPGGEKVWVGTLLTSGTGEVQRQDDTLALIAPCLAWTPWEEENRLRVRAGGVGWQIAVGGQVLANAIGHNADSADLRLNADRTVVTALSGQPETLEEAVHAFTVVLRETREPRHGSGSMIEAQVRTLLVLLWRFSAFPDTAQAQAQSARILQHFRQLLEIHFRDRWSIARYARALGIAPDRLHDICRRELGKPPRQLAQERLIHEARLMLESSTLTVEQIAAAVGFRDVGHFSRFFKSKTALAPGGYRKAVLAAANDPAATVSSSYADWP